MNFLNNRYEIIRFLGSGNYGLTYLSLDKKTGKNIALKICKINSVSRKVVSQLIRQYSILISINNPFIIKPLTLEKIFKIDNFPFEREIWFYTMPYIEDSIPIHKYIQQQADNEEVIFSVISKILYSLNYLHKNNVSHNDIQKFNILVQKNGSPVLLDIFPANITMQQYSEDFKKFFELIIKSYEEISKEPSTELRNFYYHSEEMHFDYDFMKLYLQNILKNENQHLYYFQNSEIISATLFNLQKQFASIKDRLKSRIIMLWNDSLSLSSFQSYFSSYMKSSEPNTVILQNSQDFYEYVSFKAAHEVKSLEEAKAFLQSKLSNEKFIFIFTDFLNYPSKEKKLLLDLSKTNNRIYLIRFSNIESEKDVDWFYEPIEVDHNSIEKAFSFIFNWYDFDITKISNSFDLTIFFYFVDFASKNQSLFKVEGNQIVQSPRRVKKIKDAFYEYIEAAYNIENLSNEEINALIIFLTFNRPINVNMIYSLRKYQVRKSLLASLMNKKMLRYSKISNSLSLTNLLLRDLLNSVIKIEDKRYLLQFQNYLLKNWATTIDDKSQYILNLKKLRSKDLIYEIIKFYKDFSIFANYADYSNIYDLIFTIVPSVKLLEDYCYSLKEYFYLSIIMLSTKKLKNLHQKITSIDCKDSKKVIFKPIFLKAIELIINGIEYKYDEIDKIYDEFKNELQVNSFVALIMFYTYANLLNNPEKSKEILKIISLNHLDKYDDAEYLLFLYALAAYYKKIKEDIQSDLTEYYVLQDIVYNDSKDLKYWIFYLKAAHNLGVYFSSQEGEENNEKAIQYTKESIFYNDKFKLYYTLIISYSNLAEDYLNKHRENEQALEYFNKLEQVASEAISKGEVELDIYFFALIKILAYHIDCWNLQEAKNVLLSIEKNIPDPSIFPIYFEYLYFKAFYLVKIGRYNEVVEIMKTMDKRRDNILYSEYKQFYRYLVLDVAFFFNKDELINRIENEILEKQEKSDIEIIAVDSQRIYMHVIFGHPLPESLKNKLLPVDYSSKTFSRYNYFYSLYNKIFEKESNREVNAFSTSIQESLDILLQKSRYVGDILYSFMDNFLAYRLTKNQEYLMQSVLILKNIYGKLNKIQRKHLRNFPAIKEFLKEYPSALFYLTRERSFQNQLEKISLNMKVTYEMLDKIFTKIVQGSEESIEDRFRFILRFVLRYGYCTYAALFKVDEAYSIKLIADDKKRGYINHFQDYFSDSFKSFLNSSAPIIYKKISYDFKTPHFFCIIPIVDISNKIERKESYSSYKFDEYTYFLVFESQLLVNPYWNLEIEFYNFAKSMLSFCYNQYLITEENLYDPLTKVLMRNNFLNRLRIALNKTKKGSLLFLDIDNFKSINDLYSHDFGDKVLQLVASSIKNSVRKVDIIGRYGGEEFLIYIPYISLVDAQIIANRICTTLRLQKIVSDRVITATIGIARYPEDSIFADMLISKADIACRFGKMNGKNQVVLYDPSISISSMSTSYLSGILVRDPIQSSENVRIIVELIELSKNSKISFIEKCASAMNLIMKAIQSEYYAVLKTNIEEETSLLVSNNQDFFNSVRKNLSKIKPAGLVILNDKIYHYISVKKENYLFWIFTNKNNPYTSEQNSLFQFYCDLIFLKT